MSGHVLLVPKTENPPAKVKDRGVINLVKAGGAAYNAKNGEVLLLPNGEAKRRALASELKSALFERCGIQSVDCGSDAAILSIAERFAREYGSLAAAFCEERGRTIRIVSWSGDADAARSMAAETMAAVAGVIEGPGLNPEGVGFSFAQERTPAGGVSFSLLSRCDAGAIGARQGVFCASCGAMLLPDSPYGFAHTPPDEPMEELEDIESPGANTVAELCRQTGIDETRAIKAMLYAAPDESGAARAVAAFVRGDHSVSMNKLSAWVRAALCLGEPHTATAREVEQLIGEVAGYCGPIGMPDSVSTVADERVRGLRNMVVGANRQGYHRKGCCHPRDFDPTFADIVALAGGMPCQCGGAFEASPLRESGSLFLGTAGETAGGDLKALTWRDRDGPHGCPAICHASLSIESLLLATA
ncbi:MAG: hypothetical protein LBS75_04995 [Synergistaceae bacterium]|jgi:prolyl-tRNA synthetase|nr:hypothetical protein [Synergistaceae bacterium]